ncbi:MAG: L,D-transpeptidase [Kiritimatiellia bacterium]
MTHSACSCCSPRPWPPAHAGGQDRPPGQHPQRDPANCSTTGGRSRSFRCGRASGTRLLDRARGGHGKTAAHRLPLPGGRGPGKSSRGRIDPTGETIDMPYDRLRALKLELDGGRETILHATTEYWTIGFPVSHGCVGMNIDDMLKLYDLIGTPPVDITITYQTVELRDGLLLFHPDVYLEADRVAEIQALGVPVADPASARNRAALIDRRLRARLDRALGELRDRPRRPEPAPPDGRRGAGRGVPEAVPARRPALDFTLAEVMPSPPPCIVAESPPSPRLLPVRGGRGASTSSACARATPLLLCVEHGRSRVWGLQGGRGKTFDLRGRGLTLPDRRGE